MIVGSSNVNTVNTEMMNSYRIILFEIKKALLIFALFFMASCDSNINDVRKINMIDFKPIGEARNFNLKYTDSGKIKAVLISSQMLDYSQLEFPFTEFPKGIKVTIYDDLANKSVVTSNYAISYSKSSIIDLSGNVKIKTHDGKSLETEQLYYDQKNEWFFTQKKYIYISNGSVIEGIGIDFSKDFKKLDTQQISGTYNL